MSFSRVVRPSAFKFAGKSSKNTSLTTINPPNRILMMERPFSTPRNPTDPETASRLRRFREIIDGQAGEQDPVKKEKAIAEQLLHQYFTGKDGFRVVLDANQPTISYRDSNATQVDVPESHIALYRAEKTDTVNAEGKGKISTLFLYVHGEFLQVFVSILMELMRERDDAGELGASGAAFGILQVGSEISFFEYGRGNLAAVGP